MGLYSQYFYLSKTSMYEVSQIEKLTGTMKKSIDLQEGTNKIIDMLNVLHKDESLMP